MTETVRFLLRLPAEVHEAVKALAAADRRSLNGEIVYILEQYIAESRKDREGAEGKAAA